MTKFNTMKKGSALQFIFLPCLALFASCSHNPLNIDVSAIKTPPVKIDRLERDMFSMPPDSIAACTPALEQKYGPFYARLVMGFINDGGLRDSGYATGLKHFITDKDMRNAYRDCEKDYPELSFLENGFDDAFKHYKYYFPDSALPRVITIMSGFNYSLVYYRHNLGISLEMYLGQGSLFYQMLAFPMFRTAYMSRSYMLTDAVYGWLKSIYVPNEDKNDFLSRIIHEGKLMYLEDALLPAAADTLKIKYTARQLQYCLANEYNIWAYIIGQKVLYSTDDILIQKFTGDGPFTPMFNHDYCPARTGNWIGWRIVRSYMKNNAGVTIPQLMAEKSADRILALSGYKPSK